MLIKVARNSGFCFGVEKAVNKAFDATQKNQENIYSLGPIIHNKQVIGKLSETGLDVVNTIEEIQRGTIIIRSHGVGKNIYEQAKTKALEIIDTTCPFVRRIQNIVKDYYHKGYKIAVIGDPKHPEVIGINGWCDNQALIVQNESDLPKDMDHFQKLCIVVQTTMPISRFETLSEQLSQRAEHVEKFDTTCFATKERQESAKELALEVDAMVVIGGYNSSNTQKLVEICKGIRPNSTFHIETAAALSPEDFHGFKSVGITAGASTPEWIIQDVIKYLNNLNKFNN
ncbi:4-hydroxy-3-methylbut-2-enyl diphosphate reductase [Isachenkonia alkalipeptolytica]|uniref:4-hydroxy-3-methylbut-2-enyl diphosphate reductase n=1 Tax=Isachenkonia alkalipeptolytica TaxID=2565777 RepID=A0AA43XL66_9CLOT|nr:4-hydroxy-3-methylbut-2-enyl diphosphate reductase [Isachenkonia alkalipeptolytica]NBG88757.1 4-hydroxy-3-methylbut-2-enyl diphosphate reductase [Isachenkonia alkalipeptolytica]